ncbi:MAG TPA: tetratricopeptide repeat protein [Chromatiales bacterium]|nr:tetratricopeptide repeat protein [Chromatiales bacterium]
MSSEAKPHSRSPLPVISPGLRRLLAVVFGLFALLVVDSVYLVAVTALESSTGRIYQDWFYQIVFLVHLVLGLLIVVPAVLFGALHLRRAWSRPNRRAVHAGLALYATVLALLASGILLTRFGFFEIHDPRLREAAYWVHVVTPLAVAWLFVLHRLAGPRIRWGVGVRWAAVALVFAALGLGYNIQHTRQREAALARNAGTPFAPALAKIAGGGVIPPEHLAMDQYCAQCHQETHAGWKESVHRFSSFNNPAYLFTIKDAEQALTDRDGPERAKQALRFCAACHDPVPLFSGRFEQADFDEHDPTSQKGITCIACHAITSIDSPRGNADYTITDPEHYPFTFSKNPLLQAVNRQLIKAKPEFHKATFLKPLHQTPEFCGTCHKVALPEALNDYKWLRGQNHYDSYLLSGVSGHGAQSFYYPPKAVDRCARCHMPPERAEQDFGARHLDASGVLKVHDHRFAAANTAVPAMVGMSEDAVARRKAFLEGVLRVDLFGIKQGGTIDGPLTAPIRPEIPVLQPGGRYLLETVVRTLKVGHLFTQGTADSNQVWVDITVRAGDRIIGRSGGMNELGEVDPWSHFINAYVLDRHGNRIDRRNGQDIFVALYNHQIPPGAADVVHYAFQVPEDVREPITVEAAVRYRKFDTTYLRYIQGDAFRRNDLPVATLATDRVVFPVAGTPSAAGSRPAPGATWQRWNDYGIGLLRKGNKGSSKGELRQAEAAFRQVEALGHADGALNRARVYFKEGRLDEAVEALQQAAEAGAYPWVVAWYTGLVNEQNGYLDEAIENFRDILQTRFAEARSRAFDFSKDYRVWNALGKTLFERAKQERGDSRRERRAALLHEAVDAFRAVLKLDPENVTAHYNLSLILARLGEHAAAERHRMLHLKYKPDDNAMARPVALHRQHNPAADHAAEAVVIYDLQRPGAYGLEDRPLNPRLAAADAGIAAARR